MCGIEASRYIICRKADPESKRKIENAVKYVKRNFLYNRTFYDLQTLNTDGLNWIERTANRLAHGQTKKLPAMELLIEQAFSYPFWPLVVEELPPLLYAVRKTIADQEASEALDLHGE